MKKIKEKKYVTKGTDELQFGWKLPPLSMSKKTSLKYYEKYGAEIKGVTLTLS
tara:strand:- start:258 stop:416 length:159 start_codon:yes stop_codon:yes gene_type:complete